MILGLFLLIFRLIAFLVLSIIAYLLLKLNSLIFFKSNKFRVKINRLIFKYWSLSLIKSFGGKIEVKNWPFQQKSVFVSNHISYLDIIILNAIHPFSFVAKSEIAKWPLLGNMASLVNTIFIDRSNPLAVKNLYKKIDEKISLGDSILIFPEGTTSNGEEILDFKKGVFMPIIKAKKHQNILGCIAIKYYLDEKYGNQKDKIAWWGDSNLFYHLLSLLKIPRWKVVISTTKYEIGSTKSSKLISQDTNEVVRNIFDKI